MEKYKSIIIYILIFVIVMVLAVIGYNYLSKNYVSQEEKTDSLQNAEREEITQNETTALKKATDFSVLNESRRKSKFIKFLWQANCSKLLGNLVWSLQNRATSI